MTKTIRSDVHRPAEFNPEEYVWVDGFDNAPGPWSYMGSPEAAHDYEMADGSMVYGTNWLNAHDSWLKGLVRNSATARYGDCYQCDHCGAHIRYVGVFRHVPTGDHIAVGEVCADGRFTYDKATFDRLRKAAELDRKQQRILKAWNEYRDTHDADWDALDASTNPFVRDVLARGRRYGDLSDRQFAAIVKAVDRDSKRAAERAEREANPIPKVPAPSGRVTIEGRVATTKWQTGFQGEGVLKMLVVVTTADGEYTVWCTAPSAVDPQRGDTIRLTVTLDPSLDDPTHAWGTRPTKAQIVTSAVDTATQVG